jgi:hypothetical protein
MMALMLCINVIDYMSYTCGISTVTQCITKFMPSLGLRMVNLISKCTGNELMLLPTFRSVRVNCMSPSLIMFKQEFCKLWSAPCLRLQEFIMQKGFAGNKYSLSDCFASKIDLSRSWFGDHCRSIYMIKYILILHVKMFPNEFSPRRLTTANRSWCHGIGR